MNRLKPFTYHEPKNVPQAIQILNERDDGTVPLAGGTDLLVRMKRREISVSTLVNLKCIEALKGITRGNGKNTNIGALTSIESLKNDAQIRAELPVLSEAAGLVGSPSIRNLATLGGNIGRASPASDMAPALMVLGARVSSEGPSGRKECDIDEIFTGPGTTILEKGEIITAFRIPKVVSHAGTTYLKLGRRQGMDCALVGVAGLLILAENHTEATVARIALTAVGPVPFRAAKAEEVLLSGLLNKERIKEAARVAAEESSPIDDIRASCWYRKEMVSVLTFRALMEALKIAKGEKKE